MRDLVSKISEYEEGLLEDEEIINLFQTLVDTGMAWNLQGHYGRMASAMLEDGVINMDNRNKNHHERETK